MNGKKLFITISLLLLLLTGVVSLVGAQESELTPLEELGKELFFDTNLSTPPG